MPAGRRARRRQHELVACVLAGALACLSLALAVTAGATSVLGPSTEVRAPVDATSVPHASLSSVACRASESCVAVGSYENSHRAGVPMVAVAGAGGWSRATIVPLPSDRAHSYSAAGLRGVSCPVKGGCVAVGDYESVARSVLPLVSAQRAGTWDTGFTIGLPSNAGGNQLASLASVSCAAAGTCTAVGSYTDTGGRPRLLAVSSTSGVWGAASEVPLPAGAGSEQRALGAVELAGVSCPDAKDCTAIGSFLDSAGAIVPLRATEVNGVWRAAVRAALPRGSAQVGSAEFDAVSCSMKADCVAVGFATTSLGRTEPIVEHESRGAWSQAFAIGPPRANPPGTGASLDGIACSNKVSCTAVGSLTTSTGNVTAIVLVDAGGHWQALQRVASMPAIDPHPSLSRLVGVSCPIATACVSVGEVGAVAPDGSVTSSSALVTRITPTRKVLDPAPPSHVLVRPGPGRLKVSWLPGGDGGSPVNSFTATASPGDGSCTSSTTSCTIAGLRDGTSYAVVVTATNAHGTSRPSAPSTRAVPGVAPSAPSGLRVARSHDRAALRWRASSGSPGDPVFRYVATMVGAGVTRRCSASTTSCTLAGLTRGVSYTVWVIATNAVGQSPRSASLRFRSL